MTAAPFDFYPETEWRDDLELGATELYFALHAGGASPKRRFFSLILAGLSHVC